MYTELLPKQCTLTIIYTHLLLKMTLNGKRLNHLEKNKNYTFQFAMKATLYVTPQSRANAGGCATFYIYKYIIGYRRMKT